MVEFLWAFNFSNISITSDFLMPKYKMLSKIGNLSFKFYTNNKKNWWMSSEFIHQFFLLPKTNN